jgi:hypothetical protein
MTDLVYPARIRSCSNTAVAVSPAGGLMVSMTLGGLASPGELLATRRALSVTQRALSVTQRAVSVTQ